MKGACQTRENRDSEIPADTGSNEQQQEGGLKKCGKNQNHAKA